MTTSLIRTFWIEFFEIYKSLPCLWDTRSDDYNNRHAKKGAYKRLIKKLREVEPASNRYTVVRRINAFRSNYRRELRKIEQSLKSVTGGVYKPTLWYFDTLNFLKNQKERADCRSASIEVNTKHSFLSDELIEEWEQPEPPPVKKIKINEIPNNITHLEIKTLEKKRPVEKRKYVQKTRPFLEEEHNLFDGTSELPGRNTEGASILAQGWAAQYAELSKRQRIFARKIFSDVLFCGCLDRLNENTVEDITTVLKENARNTASPLFEECDISPPTVANQQFINDDYKVSRSSED